MKINALPICVTVILTMYYLFIFVTEMLEKFLMNFFGNKQVKKAARENGLSSRNSNTFFFHIVFMINVMLF